MFYCSLGRFIFSMNAQEQQFVQELCLSIQLMQQRHMVISPWVLSAAVLVQCSGYQTNLQTMCGAMEWLKGVAVGLGTKVHWPGMCLNEVGKCVLLAKFAQFYSNMCDYILLKNTFLYHFGKM